MPDCIWCGKSIGDVFAVEEDDHFHLDCRQKYLTTIDDLQQAYATPDTDVEVFIAGGTDTRR